jgi:hypothetical protein
LRALVAATSTAGQVTGPRLLPADEITLVAGQLASYGQQAPDGQPGR